MEPSFWKLHVPPVHWRDLHFPELPFPTSLGGFLLGLRNEQGERVRLLFVLIELAGALALLALLAAVGARLLRRRLSRPARWSLAAGCVPALVAGACLAEAVFVEPNWLDVTRTDLRTDRLPAGSQLRIVLLSDFHVQGWTPVLGGLAERVNGFEPDLVIFTGDALNNAADLPLFQSVLSAMHPTYGRFAVRGNHDLDLPPAIGARLFEGGVATELTGDPVTVDDGRVTLCGAPWDRPGKLFSCLDQVGQGLRIVAYHTPDEVENVSLAGPDLFLAGHTHGGQFRLPWYGALVTMSAFDKTYEMGEYQVADTTLYVNRGIGEESRSIPVRFLCRPELTVIDVHGVGAAVEPARTVRLLPRGDFTRTLVPQ